MVFPDIQFFELLRNSVYFLVFLFLFVYLPGVAVVQFLPLGKKSGDLQKFGLVLITGILLQVLWGLIFRFIGAPWFSLFFLPVIAYYLSRCFRFTLFPFPFRRVIKSNSLVLSLIVISTFIQSFPLYHVFRRESGDLYVHSLHDDFWNISIINNLAKKIPPDHPAISGIQLKNHHYFYHFFLAIINKITSISVLDLYFRYGPVLVSFIFGLSLYAFASLFTSDKTFRALGIFFGYFTGNLSYLAPVVFPSVRQWQGNLFFADQPFDQIFNPYTVLGFSVFLYSFYVSYHYLGSKKRNPVMLVLSAFLIGSLFGIKSFGGVILISAILITSVLGYLIFRFKKIIHLGSVSLFIFLLVFLLISSPGSVSLKYAPLWLPREMMVGQDKLNLPGYADIEAFYQAGNNYLGLIKIKSIELLIYIFGNLC